MLLGGGQFCTKPGIVLVVGDDKRQFVDALARAVQSAPQVTMLNRTLRDTFADRTNSVSRASGVNTVVSGQASGHAGFKPALFETTADVFQRESKLHEEAFGPGGIVVHCDSAEKALSCVELLGGNLTGTVHVGRGEEQSTAARVVRKLESIVGRVIVNGYPTGVEVGHAIVHGGPYPATTDPGMTSVGSAAIRRWVRMIAFQDTPDAILPPALQNANPLKIERVINGTRTRDPL
jgi:NADP-dependent aldehyde dehydrogenase